MNTRDIASKLFERRCLADYPSAVGELFRLRRNVQLLDFKWGIADV